MPHRCVSPVYLCKSRVCAISSFLVKTHELWCQECDKWVKGIKVYIERDISAGFVIPVLRREIEDLNILTTFILKKKKSAVSVFHKDKLTTKANTTMPRGSKRSETGFLAPLLLCGKVKKNSTGLAPRGSQSSLIFRSCALRFNQYSEKYIFKVEYHWGKNTKVFIIFFLEKCKEPLQVWEHPHNNTIFSYSSPFKPQRSPFWRARDIPLSREGTPRVRQNTESEEETSRRAITVSRGHTDS